MIDQPRDDDQKKMICIICKTLKWVNPYSWKCDDCLSLKEKELFAVVKEAKKAIPDHPDAL